MTESLKAIMQEAEINNSFDIQSVTDTLKMTLENSYMYLYRLQRNQIRFKEFYFPKSKSSDTIDIRHGDLYLDDKLNVCMIIDVDLVKQSSRQSYRSSEFYQKEFTLEDIQNHPEIFERTILLSIDGRYHFDYKIQMVNGGKTKLILPYKMSFLYTNKKEIIDHTTSIILVDNEYYKQINTHKGTLAQMKSEDGEYQLGPKYMGVSSFRYGGTYFAFIQFADETTSSSIQVCEVQADGMLKINFIQSLKDKIESTIDNFTITIMFMKHMYEHKQRDESLITARIHPVTGKLTTQLSLVDHNDLISTDGTFLMEDEITHIKTGSSVKEVSLLDTDDTIIHPVTDDPTAVISLIHYEDFNLFNMPIPTENTLVLKQVSDEGELSTFDGSGTELHYPNMYLIKDPNMTDGDVYRFFYFYKMGYDLHYTPRWAYLYRYIKRKMKKDTMEEAVNKLYFGKITDISVEKKEALMATFQKLMDYVPMDYQYDTIDYVKNYKSNITPYEYREKKMRDFIAHDTTALKDYVRHQDDYLCEAYYLYVTADDLIHRLRYDTYEEIDRKYEFDEPKMLFIFQNDNGFNLLNMRIWIDGILCMTPIHENYFGTDYIYLPANMIRENSYIEIEVYHSFSFTKEIYLDSLSKYAEVNIINDSELVPTLSDLMFVNKDDPTIKYDISNFEVSRVRNGITIPAMKDGEKINKFATMDTIKIRAIDESVLHKYINVKISKNSYYVQQDFERSGYPIISLEGYDFNRHEDYYRLFYDGRLLSKSMYQTKTNFDNHRLQMMFKVQSGDHLAIDITPYRYSLIYKIDEVPSDGIINLEGIIDKPFDVHHYDVFLNGRKLNEKNLIPISDTTIVLNGVKSIYDLEIYEKERDEEYFGFTKNDIKYYIRLEDILDESYIIENEDKEIIEDIIGEYIEDIKKEPYIEREENTSEEEKFEQEGLEITSDIRFQIFYYEELLPTRFVDSTSAQFSKNYIKSEYPEIANTWLIEDSEIAILANKTSGSMVNQPVNILYLDPDVNVETATTTYMLGDYDDLCEKLLNK